MGHDPAEHIASSALTEAIDRDWSAVAASAAGLTFSLGTLLLYTFGVFVRPLIHEFGWSHTEVAVALAIFQYTLALTAPGWGLLIDRFGPRRVIVPSVIALSALVASLALLTSNIWQYYLVFAAVSLTAGGATPIGYSAIIVRKFERHLGLALGLALMGVGLGAAALPPLAQALVERVGWRHAYAALGGLTLLVTLPAALVATGHSTRKLSRVAGAAADVAVLPFIMTRAFVVMCLIFLLLGIISIGGLANLVPMMIARGFSPAAAAHVAAITGLAAIAGRGGVGLLLDRIHPPVVVCAAALMAGTAFLLIGETAGEVWAYLAAMLLGAVVGAEVDFTAFFVRRYFGRHVFGRLYGLTFGLFIVGSGTGPLLISASFDRLGSYQPGMLIFATASLGVALLTFAMPNVGALKRM